MQLKFQIYDLAGGAKSCCLRIILLGSFCLQICALRCLFLVLKPYDLNLNRNNLSSSGIDNNNETTIE